MVKKIPSDMVENRGTGEKVSVKLDSLTSELAQRAKQSDLDTTNINVALKAEKSYVDNQIANVMSGSPKGVYATLSALQTAFPTGNSNIYLVTSDGKWYYWSGSAWTAGGTYQATGFSVPVVEGEQSKNLFNKDTITTGRFINTTTGALQSSANYIASDFISVTANATYTAKETLFGGAFYDSAKVYISGINSNTFTTPANAAFVRISMLATYKDTQQLELGSVSTRYMSYKNAVKKDTIPSVTKDMLDPSIALDVIPSKNLFNKATVTTGKYLDATGALISNVNFSVSDFIPATPSTQYAVKKFWNVGLYRADKTFISTVGALPLITTADTAFMRVTTDNTNGTNLNEQQVELGSVSTGYETFGNKLKQESINGLTVEFVKKRTKVHVGIGYEFATISSALNAIKNANEDTVYDIMVHPGTYNETFRTKDYVNIKGDHAKSCIIDYTAPDPANWVNESTVFLETDTILEDLTIRTKDAKYPVHTDAQTGDYRAVINRCVLEHKGHATGAAGTPLGIGLYQNQHIEVNDSELIGSYDVGVSGIYCHNNQSSYGNGYRSLRARNNTIKGVSYGINLNAFSDILDQSNDAFLEGNRIQALTAEIFINSSTDLSWNVKAHGNTLTRVYQPNNQYIVEQPGFTRRVKNNGADLFRGSVAVLWDTGAVKGITTADSPLVVGICLQDIPSGSIGVIQVSGWVNAVKVNGATAIASDELLSTHSVYGVAKKGSVNPFALSKGSYSVADDNGMIPAVLLPRMLG